ncbi:MAG: HesA/MoeB/ThiF family protein [Dactylosporangium sp.]|nr:HesA/MoeB/ThiF family protein [Dactylosporangium sp.]
MPGDPRPPALVAPGPPLNAAERERYARQLLLPEVGEIGQRRLLAARVLVVGAGGLGSPALMSLAAAGVGTLGIVDHDIVDVSNLHRQVLYTPGDVGGGKAERAGARLGALNPGTTLVPRDLRLDASNATDLCSGFDVVLNCADNVATRYAVDDACVRLGIPDVLGAASGLAGQAGVFWRPHGPSYRDLFPEPPAGPTAGPTAPSGAGEGVLGPLCAMVAGVLATETARLITGLGTGLVGRLLTVDATTMRWRTFAVPGPPTGAP